MKPAPFAYHRAHSVAEAVALLAELGDEALTPARVCALAASVTGGGA